jgi:hypothetical protein
MVDVTSGIFNLKNHEKEVKREKEDEDSCGKLAFRFAGTIQC